MQGTSSTTSMTAILVATFLSSIGSSVLWIGLGFVTKEAYGFSQVHTLMLFLCGGIIYTLMAGLASPLVRIARQRMGLGTRSILVITLLVQAIAAPLVLLDSTIYLWIAVIIMEMMAAIWWPLIESYLTSGHGSRRMSIVIGRWNITWTTAMAIATLGLVPVMMLMNSRWMIVLIVPASIGSLACLKWFTSNPSSHQPVIETEPISKEYVQLLASARVLLPVGTMLIGALSPLVPYVLQRLELHAGMDILLTCSWLLTRVMAMILMWLSQFWHGRWSMLAMGALALCAGFSITILSGSLPLSIIGFCLFGLGEGIIYYAAFYYAMNVGRAEVEAGGTHEMLIGGGYALGSAASLAGALAGGYTTILVFVMGCTFLAILPAIRPWLHARHLRTTA
ncbi:MAG: hypothetical protein CMJ32_09030 [Phycisphaerae bacterium]|nr:hypothetical protein [Phycisphaerae bacterium]